MNEMTDDYRGYVLCLRTRRVRGWGHDENYTAGEVYEIRDERYYGKLIKFRTQSGRNMVPSFVAATVDDYEEAGQEVNDRPVWPLEQNPADYIRRNGEDAKWAERAREVIVWDAAYAADQDDDQDDETTTDDDPNPKDKAPDPKDEDKTEEVSKADAKAAKKKAAAAKKARAAKARAKK